LIGVHRIDDPDYVAREYGSLERLATRRLDRTDWLRFGGFLARRRNGVLNGDKA
jgi:hypothetical protein